MSELFSSVRVHDMCLFKLSKFIVRSLFQCVRTAYDCMKFQYFLSEVFSSSVCTLLIKSALCGAQTFSIFSTNNYFHNIIKFGGTIISTKKSVFYIFILSTTYYHESLIICYGVWNWVYFIFLYLWQTITFII